MICFFHSADLDGHCSGAIVKHKYPNTDLVGINYGHSIPWDSIKDNKLFIVDYSFNMSDMKKANDIADSVTWIDHHMTAINDYNDSNLELPGLRRVGIGACQLTWEYLYPDQDVPYFIKLLAQYDVFDHHDPNTLVFQYGMQNYNTMPYVKDSIWTRLFNNEEGLFEKILEIGQIIKRQTFKNNKISSKSLAFDLDFENYRFIAANISNVNSLYFNNVIDARKHDACMTFSWRNRGYWTVSMYSDKIDVGEIAKKYGGGGHKGAAGFQCKELPFKLV